jgi:hypothetical protein
VAATSALTAVACRSALVRWDHQERVGCEVGSQAETRDLSSVIDPAAAARCNGDPAGVRALRSNIAPFRHKNALGNPSPTFPATDTSTTSPRSLMAKPALLLFMSSVPRSCVPVSLVHNKAWFVVLGDPAVAPGCAAPRTTWPRLFAAPPRLPRSWTEHGTQLKLVGLRAVLYPQRFSRCGSGS